MLWILSLHIIFMVAWFAGLFYLPRLFVYHANSVDTTCSNTFKIMEHKLYYFIMTPAAILTTAFGLWLLALNFIVFIYLRWMIIKLILVAILWGYHLYCGQLLAAFKKDNNAHSAKFYRFFNEGPTLLLIGIIFMAIIKP